MKVLKPTQRELSKQVSRRLAGSVPRARDSKLQRVSSGVGPTKKEKEVLSFLMGHHRMEGGCACGLTVSVQPVWDTGGSWAAAVGSIQVDPTPPPTCRRDGRDARVQIQRVPSGLGAADKMCWG